MERQEGKINYNLIISSLMLAVIAVLIIFYFSYSRAKLRINELETERQGMVSELTLTKANLDRLAGLNEVNEIELQEYGYQVQTLLDSIQELNFSVARYRRDLRFFNRLQRRYDSVVGVNEALTNNLEIALKRLRDDDLGILKIPERGSDVIVDTTTPIVPDLPEPLGADGAFRVQEVAVETYTVVNEISRRSRDSQAVALILGCFTIDEGSGLAIDALRDLDMRFEDAEGNVLFGETTPAAVAAQGNSRSMKVSFRGRSERFCEGIRIATGSLTPGTYTFRLLDGGREIGNARFTLE